MEYSSEGECVSVRQSVQWMSKVIDEMRVKGLPTKSNGRNFSIPQLHVDDQTLYFYKLGVERFNPWTPQKYTNKLYFIELRGLNEILLQLYAIILPNQWIDTPPQLKYTEYLILLTFRTFFENFSLLRLGMRHGVLEMVVRSLFKAKIQPGIKFTDIVEHGFTNLPDLCNIVKEATNVLGK